MTTPQKIVLKLQDKSGRSVDVSIVLNSIYLDNSFNTDVSTIVHDDLKDFNIYVNDNKLASYKFNGNILENITDCLSIGLDSPSDEICFATLQRDGLMLRCVDEQTDKMCSIAVNQNGLALEFVKNQTREICIDAVKQNGLALEFVKTQDKEICFLAVQQNGMALKYVKYKSSDICKVAIAQNINAFDLIFQR